MNNILIIGSGQLGSRHLQAMALLAGQYQIYVVDPSKEALRIAEERYLQVRKEGSPNVTYLENNGALPKDIIIGIIATSSAVRSKVIESLIPGKNIQYMVLEKVLFQSEQEYQVIHKLLSDNNIITYVNCPRRMVDYYKLLKNSLEKPFDMNVSGNNWGLGSNGIHFIDLFGYLTESDNVSIDMEHVDSTILESKRQGYIEFTGTMIIKANGCSLTLSCYDGPIRMPRVLITNKDSRFDITEGAKSTVVKSLAESGWEEEKETFKIPYQSEMTNLIIESLITKGSCDLTTFTQSMGYHLEFIRGLLTLVNHTKKTDLCQIT